MEESNERHVTSFDRDLCALPPITSGVQYRDVEASPHVLMPARLLLDTVAISEVKYLILKNHSI